MKAIFINVTITEIAPNTKKDVVFSDSALDYSVYKGGSGERAFKGGACGALQNSFFVLPDGKVTICELMYWNPDYIIGDLRKQTIVDVWNSQKAWAIYNQENAIREESRCSSCQTLDFCSENRRRCAAKVVRAYGDQNFDYPDPRCAFAPEHCDFHIMNGVKAFLVHHVFTTIDLGADDLPHLVLCTMSITTKNQSGNIEMRGTNGTHYYVLDVMHNIWHKRRDIVLSWQERDVLVLSFRGLSVTEIAQIMCKSVDAIKTCKQKMFKRMGVKNIVEAVAYATNYRLT